MITRITESGERSKPFNDGTPDNHNRNQELKDLRHYVAETQDFLEWLFDNEIDYDDCTPPLHLYE